MLDNSNKRYLEKVRRKAGKAINQYDLIKGGDSILVALSGGKDSMSMLDILATRRKYLPVDYELFAATIMIENFSNDIDIDWMRSLCEKMNIPFYVKKTTIDLAKKPAKHPCFVCSWNRRKELFYIAQELNCKKIAFGHNLDDAIETLLMNMVFHSEICAIPARLKMFNDNIEVIRPLILLSEHEIKRYSEIKGFKTIENQCQYEDSSKREEIKKIIGEFMKMNKLAKINLFKSMANIQREYLP